MPVSDLDQWPLDDGGPAIRPQHRAFRFRGAYLQEGSSGYGIMGSYMWLEENRRRKMARRAGVHVLDAQAGVAAAHLRRRGRQKKLRRCRRPPIRDTCAGSTPRRPIEQMLLLRGARLHARHILDDV